MKHLVRRTLVALTALLSGCASPLETAVEPIARFPAPERQRVGAAAVTSEGFVVRDANGLLGPRLQP